jgi:uncharacterized coiled-coil DUF342 family protein
LLSEGLDAASQQLDVVRRERDEALAAYQETGEEAATGRERLDRLRHDLHALQESAAQVRADFETVTARAEAAEASAQNLSERASAGEPEHARRSAPGK